MTTPTRPAFLRTRTTRGVAGRLAAAFALGVGLLAPAAMTAPVFGSGAIGANAIWYVGPGGGSGGCASPDFDSGSMGETIAITAAVIASSGGDVVHLCPNVYDLTGMIYFDHALTFEGDASTNTTVSGGDSVQLFVSSSAPVVFRDLTLRDGHAGGGGAIAVYNASVGIERVRILSSDGGGSGGGGIYAQSSTVSATDSTFVGNSGDYGGAISGSGEITLLRTSFIGNSAVNIGGAILTTADLSITGGSFVDNTGGGSGAVAVYGANIGVVGATFERNRAPAGNGGAITMTTGVVSVTDSTFVGNSASVYGGAIFAYDTSVVRSQFTDNTAGTGGASGAGGAIMVFGTVTAVSSSFVRNRAEVDSGGGIWATGLVSAVDSTFVGNRAAVSSGAVQGYPIEVTASTFAWNVADALTFAGHVNGNITSTDSIFAGGTCGPTIVEFGTNLSTDANCPGGSSTVAESDLRLDTAPKLNSATTLTLALLPGSVAIDATGGTCSTATDQRGTVRPQNGRCDIGAYEFSGSLAPATVGVQASVGGVDIVSAVPTITTGDTVAIRSVVTGSVADSLGGGTFDPTGSVVFRYCRSSVAVPTSCTGPGWTTIGTISLTSGDAASDGSSVAYLSGWTPPQGGYYLLAASYVSTGGVYQSAVRSDATSTGALHVLAYVTLSYGGPFLALTDGTTRLTLTANASISPSDAADGCPVTFRLDPSAGIGPLTGTISGGTATATADFTSGVYTVTVSIGGDCTGGTDTGVLVVGTAGTKGATGGGWYRVAGFSPPKVHFGFTIQVQRHALVTITRGQILWMTRGGGGWRLKASIPATDGTVWITATCPPGVGDASGNSNPVCGTFGGTGLLQKWDPILEDWSAYTTVNFRATVWDGGSRKLCKGHSGKHCTSQDVADWFGMQMTRLDGTPITTAGDGVPVSGPIRLYVPDGRGSIRAL